MEQDTELQNPGAEGDGKEPGNKVCGPKPTRAHLCE